MALHQTVMVFEYVSNCVHEGLEMTSVGVFLRDLTSYIHEFWRKPRETLNGQEPHQWLSGSALKTGRWEVPGSISGGTCRSSREEFSVVFTETCFTGQDPLERSSQRAFHIQPQAPRLGNRTHTQIPNTNYAIPYTQHLFYHECPVL